MTTSYTPSKGAVTNMVRAMAMAFLASEDARLITGVNLPVDNGLRASNGQPPM
jgi:NAD(P)-dependent dehydrogenase (short-subunit alcohol dehydrogenase family)